jgi:hypothetical protein
LSSPLIKQLTEALYLHTFAGTRKTEPLLKEYGLKYRSFYGGETVVEIPEDYDDDQVLVLIAEINMA